MVNTLEKLANIIFLIWQSFPVSVKAAFAVVFFCIIIIFVLYILRAR